MSQKLTEEEVALMIRARRLIRSKGLPADADVTEICKAAGVSRKTGYQWAQKHEAETGAVKKEQEERFNQLRIDLEKLKEENDWLSFQNRGMKLAWDLHDVDDLIAAKKNTSTRKKSGKP